MAVVRLDRHPKVLELKREIVTARKGSIRCRALLYFQRERQRIEREHAGRFWRFW